MAVRDESLERLRQSGRDNRTARAAGEMAAYEQGRTDMWECVADSSRVTTRAAIKECQRKLRR